MRLLMVLFLSVCWADVGSILHDGRAEHVQGRLDEAAFEYRKAIRFDLFDPEPHLDLGVVLFQIGKTTESIKELQLAVRNGSKDPATQMMLALASFDPADSREYYKQAIAKEPAFAVPGFDPDEVLLKRKLLSQKAPRSTRNSERWAALAKAEVPPPPPTPQEEANTAKNHGLRGAALSEKAEDPKLSKAQAAELKRQAAAEYATAISLSLAP